MTRYLSSIQTQIDNLKDNLLHCNLSDLSQRDVESLNVSRNKIITALMASEQFDIVSNGHKSFRLISRKSPKSKVVAAWLGKGLYLIGLKTKDFDILLYVGVSGVESIGSIANRIARFLCSALCTNVASESHSSKALADILVEAWIDALYIKYIPIEELRSSFRSIPFIDAVKSVEHGATLQVWLGEGAELFETRLSAWWDEVQFPHDDKIILGLSEQYVIEKEGPCLNKQHRTYSKKYWDNVNKFEQFRAENSNGNGHAKLLPLFDDFK